MRRRGKNHDPSHGTANHGVYKRLGLHSVSFNPTMSWKDLAAAKKQAQLEKIPQEWLIKDLPTDKNVVDFPKKSGLLSDLDLEITESSVATLLQNLASSKWSSVQVTTSFSKRAIIAHQLVNCLTEIFLDRALARAKELDEHLARTGKVVGPLHGLPVSLKDQVNIKGIESTMGYIAWIGKPVEKSAILVDILEESGAVLFVKTNVPQTLMWVETHNLIFGRTSNPHNRTLTSGGSSGGEGALIALKGSPLGLGSDIGGSVRVPAGFCGIYGFRPSYHRIPYSGAANSLEGQDSVNSVFGPLSQSLDGLTTVVKTVLGKQPWLRDAHVIRKQWSEEEYALSDHGGKGGKLCFAIMWDDGITKPDPPIRRGLELTKKALLAAGHEVIDWKPYKQAEIGLNTFAIWSAGSGDDYRSVTQLSGEPLIGSMAPDATGNEVRPVFGKPLSAYELWQVQKKKRDLRQEYLNHWSATVAQTSTGRPVDAVITPVAPYASAPHGLNRNLFYTVWCNALDYPSVIIPTGAKVDPVLDVKQPRTEFFSPMPFDKDIYERYTPELYEDAPIPIQVVGRTMEDEAVLAMSKVVDDALRSNL
ncbi:Amidase domain-containing protein [Mycena indigotica]|uniref:amidase n=1 Tax=Mycena indigotica TaxID=2126181 RepID=A0A8H6W9Y8_9AGAR|nr:Amidase domain-containing protein [Mycena indigotica]KAF7307128.1 Amidase domain-containing protein [Mycena indigotica]